MILNLSAYFEKGDRWLYNYLSQLRQNEFANDFTLQVNYSHDIFEDDSSPGQALCKLQEYLALLDFPNFFVTVKTSYENIARDLKKVRDMYCSYEDVINHETVIAVFDKKINTYDSFCVYPWMHLYLNPQGQVGPCCYFDEHFSIGNLSEEKINDVINSASMMELRKKMMSGKRPKSCNNCWHKEDNGIVSARQEANITWKKYTHLVEQTEPNGYFSDFKLRYLDFRFSNTCNLKCRMCSGKLSSSIAQEDFVLYHDNKNIELKLSKDNINNTLEFIKNNINNLDQIYFAGGEPILINEHYEILNLLIDNKRTDIPIYYNTNLTRLSYKKHNVLDYWRQFSNISIGASIDLIGAQAEYVRSGTDYEELERNYEKIKSLVNFSITSIVHLLNIFNLPKLQQHWIDSKKLSPNALSFNILTTPAHMTLQVLPSEYKNKVTDYVTEHIQWLQNNGSTNLIGSWQDVLQYMNASDQSHLLTEFFRLNDNRDQYRNEVFEEIFPEYKNLRSYAAIKN